MLLHRLLDMLYESASFPDRKTSLATKVITKSSDQYFQLLFILINFNDIHEYNVFNNHGKVHCT